MRTQRTDSRFNPTVSTRWVRNAALPNYFNLLGHYVQGRHLPVAAYRGADFRWYVIKPDGQLHTTTFATEDEAKAYGLTLAHVGG